MISCLQHFYGKFESFLLKFFQPILLLTLRIMVASVFLKSGLTKISNFDVTIALFENEYGVPLLSPVCAAYLATFFELTCSAFLIAGFSTRLAALPLIGMTLIIQLFVFQNPDHFFWIATLATILTFGAGKISLDNLLKKLCQNCIKKAESSK